MAIAFTEESYIVDLWVRNVKSGKYTRDEIPNISNLREVVFEILDRETVIE